MSDNHKILVRSLGNKEKHPNADNLSIVTIDGYQIVVNTKSWEGIEYGVYIPPESIVPLREEYAFLASDKTLLTLAQKKNYRIIKAKKIRNVVSYGLLMPVPSEVTNPYDGMDVSHLMGIEHYEPEEISEEDAQNNIQNNTPKKNKIFRERNYPDHICADRKYDLPNLRKICNSLPKFDHISVTEKIHGCVKFDTPVLMANGLEKEISKISPGEEVLTFNLTTKEFEKNKVNNVIVQEAVPYQKWFDITLENGRTLTITSDHQILTDKGWITAEELDETYDIISI